MLFCSKYSLQSGSHEGGFCPFKDVKPFTDGIDALSEADPHSVLISLASLYCKTYLPKSY